MDCTTALVESDPRPEPATREELIMHLRARRDAALSLREQAEWSVEIEEVLGGRPPTRGWP